MAAALSHTKKNSHMMQTCAMRPRQGTRPAVLVKQSCCCQSAKAYANPREKYPARQGHIGTIWGIVYTEHYLSEIEARSDIQVTPSMPDLRRVPAGYGSQI
jgi:hypothetical protein